MTRLGCPIRVVATLQISYILTGWAFTECIILRVIGGFPLTLCKDTKQRAMSDEEDRVMGPLASKDSAMSKSRCKRFINLDRLTRKERKRERDRLAFSFTPTKRNLLT
eukprot:scaffold328_cov130-Cylindrotheca_fusiformis.AAC.25